MGSERVLRALAVSCAFGMLVVAVSASRAEVRFSGLFLDVGTPKGAAKLRPIQADFDALRTHLAAQVHADQKDFTIVRAAALTRNEIQLHLRDYAQRVQPKSIAFIYLRAYVTHPAKVNSIYLYPADASIKTPVDARPGGGGAPIRDTEFYEWLGAFAHATVILVLDFRTEDLSLARYFGTRRDPDASALTVIARTQAPRTVAAYLVTALRPESDGDNDGVINFGELVNGFQQVIYTDLTANDAVVAGTGTPDLVIYEVPSAIVVETRPSGAKVTINGQVRGEAPLRHAPLSRATYQVSAQLPGYRTAAAKTVKVSVLSGKAYPVSFDLEPVHLRGQVIAPEGAQLGAILLAVTPDVVVQAELKAPGPYDLALGTPPFTAGVLYRVSTGTLDDKFFGDAEFVFDGSEDIVRDIRLEERTLWQIASIRYAAGFTDEALATAVEARKAGEEIPELSQDFAVAVIESWARLTLDPRSMIACAVLAEQLGDTGTAREYWQLAKRAAPEGSPEHARAAQAVPDSAKFPTVIVAGALLILLFASAFTLIRFRRRPRSASGAG